MAVAYASSTLNISLNSTGDTDMTLPSGSAAGDVVFVFASWYGNASETYEFNTNFSMIISNEGFGGSNRKHSVGYRTLDSTDISNGYIRVNSGAGFSSTGRAHLVRVTGGDATTIVADYAYDADDDTSKTFANTITPPNPDCLLLFYIAAAANVTMSSQAITTSNPSWTELHDASYNDGANYNSESISYATRTQTTATGDSSATLSGNATAGGTIIAIQPVISASTTLDAAGIVTLTTPEPSFVLGNIIPVDSAGTVTLSTPEPTISTSTKTAWTNETKPSTTWTNE